MAQELRLAFLGNVEICRAGVPVTGFRSRKVQALLCYLAATGRPHLRPALAGLLWGELPESSAQNNLRKALTNLRGLVGPHLSITRQDVALNRESPYWLDVEAFESRLKTLSAGPKDSLHAPAEAETEHLQAAVDLYRGDFLEGFYVRQAPAFEEWVLAQRMRLRELALQALHTLAVHYTWRGEAGRGAAIDCTTRLLALEPWREDAHRQLMLLLARSGQRSAALAQYETCRRMLVEELGVEPGVETVALYERIRDGRPGQRDFQVTVDLPPFLATAPPRLSSSVPFVAREHELAQLEGYLEQALARQGQVVFVTGEAGTGKTVLVREFSRHAQAQHADLVVASGNCTAFSGLGDPYLPFCQILGLLTGDVESSWAAGTLSTEGTRRLWALMPHAVQALVEISPDLVGTLIGGSALVGRAATAAPGGARWLDRLQELLAGRKPDQDPALSRQSDLFEQIVGFLASLARQRPLLLVLDDLQWADAGSVSLLFHLGRRLEDSRILVVGIYRPADVAMGRRSDRSGEVERHPLEPLVHEFQRRFGHIQVHLAQSGDRPFVEALLDSEPNRLGSPFRRSLYERTQGHALCTVETLRGMQERGDLILDEEGRWVEGSTIDWNSVPARVEGAIAERFARLPAPLRETLQVASVEGEAFTAQVVAQVQGAAEREIVGRLSDALDQRHRLVRGQGSQRVGTDGQRVSRYRFRHILFQEYAYNSLDETERARLHGAVGSGLEQLYTDQPEAVAAQLARHFQTAGWVAKAATYYLQAGDRAHGLYAHQEAIDHYQRALALLKEMGDLDQAARTLSKLGLTYHTALEFRAARQAYDESFAMWERVGNTRPAEPLPPAPHALRVLLRDERLPLDPTFAEEDITYCLLDQLFSALLYLGPDMDVTPEVAQSWEISEGGRRYAFNLRDDVYWSDGVRVTARDFEYAWKRILDPATGSPVADLLYDVVGARAFHLGRVQDREVVGVRTLDDRTLVVELERPTGYFLHRLTLLYPVPRHVVEAYGMAWTEAGNMVTNGPFRPDASQPDHLMAFSRNPAYHGRFTGNVERVELILLPFAEWRTIWAMYEADDLDSAILAASEIGRARQRHAGEYVPAPYLATNYVGFDVSRSPFADRRVRHAFVLAMDRETLADVVLQGGPLPATGGFVPPGMPGHSAGIGLPYDPDRARRLLAEAGYPGGRGFPTIRALASEGSCDPRLRYLQTLWRQELGVEIMWDVVDWETFRDRLEKAPPHIYTCGWAGDCPDPHSFLSMERPDIRRYTQWRDEAYDRLVERARRAMDQGERMALYRQADRILVEEAALAPLFYVRLHMLIKPWVKRFPISAMKQWFWKDVIVEPH